MTEQLSDYAASKIADMTMRGFSPDAIATTVHIGIERARDAIKEARARALKHAEDELDRERARTFEKKLKAIRAAVAAEKEAAAKIDLDPSSATLTVAEIIAATASKHGLRVSDLRSMRRIRRISYARQEAIYLAYDLTPAGLSTIGRAISRDNSTVIFAIRQHALRNGLPLPRGMKPGSR
ncbi:helix-turn-helix domain-containing protein [Kaistia sp. MMO-174]|uniref:helix-turn-helix domain-containing protein n=1 Tax=Kaistia sp. MMO-174 TaxID=3081256 RepID=UPI0030176B00